MGQTLFERGDGGAAVGRLLKRANGERVEDNGAVSGPSTPRSLRPTEGGTVYCEVQLLATRGVRNISDPAEAPPTTSFLTSFIMILQSVQTLDGIPAFRHRSREVVR